MTLRRIIPVALSALLLAAACCTQRQAAVNTPPVHPQQSRPVRTANFSCAVEGATLNGQIRLVQDSILWITASKIIELGRVKATPDSVFFCSNALSRYYRGTYDDLYRRAGYLTSFAELQTLVTAPDADAQLQELARRFNLVAEIHIQSWRTVAETTFPFYIPSHFKPI